MPFTTFVEALNRYGAKPVVVFDTAFGTSASRNEPFELPVMKTVGTFVKAYPKLTVGYISHPPAPWEDTVTLEVPYRILKF